MMTWIRDLRMKRNVSQAKIATECNISRQHYNFIENKKRRPSPELAQRIAEVLGIPNEWPRLLQDKI